MATAVLPGDEKTVQLRGMDKRIPFNITVKAANQSKTLKRMMEELGDMKAGDWIPLPSIAPIVLGYIVEWLNYHKDDSETPSASSNGSPTLPSEPGKRDRVFLTDWDLDYFRSVDIDCLSPLMNAAYQLEIDVLLDQTAQFIADNYFRGFSPQQVERILEEARENLTKDD